MFHIMWSRVQISVLSVYVIFYETVPSNAPLLFYFFPPPLRFMTLITLSRDITGYAMSVYVVHGPNVT
jgi:hypothetical protein